MKRFLASALIIGVSTFGLVGCDEKSQTKTTTESKGPEGSVKETDTKTIQKTGNEKDNATTPAPVEAPK